MSENRTYVPVNQIDKRIAEIQEQLARLPIELEALRRIKAEAVSLSGFPAAEDQGPAGTTAKLGPKQAVLHLLQYEKLSTKDVIVRLEQRILSGASDVRRVLYSTVFSLKKNGFVEEADGLLAITVDGIKELEKLSRK